MLTHCFPVGPVFRLGAIFLLGVVGWGAESDWIPLFNGRTLEGWRAGENAASFRVVEGMIACDGPRAHLFYEGPAGGARFRNFELSAEVLSRPGANSGVFFHTAFQAEDWLRQGYEVQVNNTQPTHDGYHEFKKTGSLYAVRNVYRSPVEDNEWFTLRIVVEGKHVQVWVNDVQTVDYYEPEEPVREGRGLGRRLSEGTFALQCHDPESRVFYRNLKVRPLPDDLPVATGVPPVPAPVYGALMSRHAGNFPVIDLHAHLKGGLTVEDVLQWSRATGIGYGIAVNCGLGFSVTNDAGIHAFVDSLQGPPVFTGMQAEGREWVNLFSDAALDRFDYIFTDAMTFTDQRGKRTRLWMPDEVAVDDPQAFMELLVGTIERILTDEPVDIYVNPTFLPAVIAADYDRLWTPARMDRVIAAAVRNGVAIEINDRYHLPRPAFIRRAKAAGVKFTFGTNNGGRNDLGYLAYPLQMIEECGLGVDDLFVPGETRGRRQRARLAAAEAAGAGRFIAYIGTYTGRGSRGIYAARFDAGAGAVTPLGCVAEMANPSFLALHPNGRFLYAVGETGQFRGKRAGLVSAFAIDRDSGQLRLLNQASSEGPGPCHLSVDATGRLVMVANYGGGSIAALPVREDGSLGEATTFIQHTGSSVNPGRQKEPHAHSINPSPDNRFALVADLGIDRVLAYRIDAAKGTLTPNDPPAVALPPGSGPRHLAFQPGANRVFVINELLSTLASFAYDPEPGTLSPIDTQSTLPTGFAGENSTAEVQAHPSGRFVYGSNRGHDSIAGFRVETDGRLRPLGQTPSGGRHPRNFAIEPTGRYLWAANRDSDNITIFRVDAATGELAPTGVTMDVPMPVCVRFLPVE
ncbi:MAG: beta-propeller fold lactonase family protein [Verrucomicrobiales bacterium]|nr:beta-propeller fold lactonase family protein [Verrucomicrobiales bacterium]